MLSVTAILSLAARYYVISTKAGSSALYLTILGYSAGTPSR